MKISSAVFELSSPKLDGCPRWALPEFAFIGRSNVGKSSLINLLADRRELAKVSDLPGKTQLINFYVMNDRWALVDLPGYGYAHVGKQKRAAFNEAVAEFLSERRNLARVFVLIDSRLPPQAIDLEFLQWMGACKAPYALVFTKTDKQSATQTQASIAAFMKSVTAFRAEPPEFFLTSASTGKGRQDVLGCIQRVLDDRNRASG